MKRGKIILILILMSISISLLVYSFAYTTTTHTSVDSNYLMVSEILFGLTDAVESISLEQQTPTIDKFGVSNDSFSFSITNTSNVDQEYTIRLVDKDIVSTIANEELRYQLTRNGIVEEIKDMPNSGVIDSGVISRGDEYEYSIIVWLGYDASTSGGTWNKSIKVEAGNSNIDGSGANEPILLENMIPVFYDEEDRVWRKADQTNSNPAYKWYDYDDRMWANAVTIYNNLETDYFNATEGSEIKMDDITMFYVWIPRFKYELFDNGSTKLINVSFEKGINSTGTMKCSFENGVETCTGEKVSYTHPAFTFDNEELTGYWINKFGLSSNMLSVPNQQSQYNSSIDKVFYNIRRMELEDNKYGFSNGGSVLNDDGTISNDNNNYDIHLSKNFEIAALSYLTYSKYGKYSNILFDNENKNIFNNNVEYSGFSFVDNVKYDYNVEYYGTGASTTGNIYGVYDLNGAYDEIVMANILDSNNLFRYDSVQTNFLAIPALKYYDAYANASAHRDLKSFYGDAFNEFDGVNNSAVSLSNRYFLVRKSIRMIDTSSGNFQFNYKKARSVIAVEQDIYITKW